MKTFDYMHATHSGCITTDEGVYENQRELVLKEDAEHEIELLREELQIWKTYAVELGRQLAEFRKA